MNDTRQRVVLGWHMHQPEYRDPVSGEFRLPWTYLHAIKDYADMAAHLEAEPGARAVVNFAPLLLEQMADYSAQISAHLGEPERQPLRDPLLAALSAASYPADAAARLKIIDGALQAHPQRLIGRYPAYRTLAEQAERIRAQPLAAAVAPDAFIADLVVWFHLAWMGETIKRSSRFVQVLIAQERGFTPAQRQRLLALIGELVSGIVPRYRALAQAGRIELSLTPYGHPIIPLLLDFNAARESLPEAPLPPEPGYPGGAERARWHFEQALNAFEQSFGVRPIGCWCSEGGVSEATLRLLAENGFQWTATGQSVLSNSSGGSAVADRPYRLGAEPVRCFFRDDELSDRIGFQYSNWHGDDAVADLVRALERHARERPPGGVLTIFLDGENAWEHFPANGYYFLGALYKTLANHPTLRLTTFAEALSEGVLEGQLQKLTAGSWVYGSFSTWIGYADKNRGWSLLVEAKLAFDRAAPLLSAERRREAERQLAVCEGSDWFWWLGDDNPERAVSDFESLYRLHLARLYKLLDEPAPARLNEVLSRGRGSPAVGGVMKTGKQGSAPAAASAGPSAQAKISSASQALTLPLFDQRRSGVLLHLTSLPGDLGSGDLSHNAYRFVEFLASAGMSVWQVLPVGPTHADRSPYLSLSANAGNPMLISLDWLVDRGWLDSYGRPPSLAECERHRHERLAAAHRGFVQKADADWHLRFHAYCDARADWLADYALFMALREEHEGAHWVDWPAPLRDRKPAALAAARTRLATSIERECFQQFVFSSQWAELRAYARQHGIHLFGDLPLFVAHNSADVWARRELFAVNAQGGLEKIAGVPPDYYAVDGQIWGNPLYRWPAHANENFAWWVQRLRTQLALFDVVRVDHFRGLDAHWELPAGAKTAREGHWVASPGAALLAALQAQMHPLPLVAEDLGEITESVHRLRQDFGLPGMRVLQFGFDGSAGNVHLPHNYEPATVVYPGTHDNPTSLEWHQGLDVATRALVQSYFGHHEGAMPWPLIESALASVARLALIPMQDLLGLGAGERMNTPGTAENNWNWRFGWHQLSSDLAPRLRMLNQRYARG